jgi:hypothetical protein
MMDYLKNLHRFSVAEIIKFEKSKAAPWLGDGTGIYFYSADGIERLIFKQEEKVRELETKLKRITNAHDKLFLQLTKLRRAVERASR